MKSLIDKVRETDKEVLIRLIQEQSSKRAVLRCLGVTDTHKLALEWLSVFIKENNINILHHGSGKPYWARFSKEFVESAISNSDTWKELLIHFNLSDKGHNLRTIRRVLKFYDITFIPKAGRFVPRNRYEFNDIFRINSTVSSRVPRDYIIRNKLLKEECTECGVTTTWNNKPLVLQLDHINGIKNDNRIENLRFLCPNCHTQTSTFGTKKRLTNNNV